MGKRAVDSSSADAVGSVVDAVDHKKRRPTTNDLPTKEEQRQLQQVDLLMKTNILQLKVDSMLEEVSVGKLLHKRKAQGWIDSIVTLLTMKTDDGDNHNRLQDVLGSTIDSLWMSSNGIAGLSLVNASDAKMSITFAPPTKVDIIGSFIHDTVTSSHVNIDVALTLPDEMFDSRDILNHRYFDKRKLYLAALSKGLADECSVSKRFDGMSLAAFKGDSRKPILVLTAPFKLQGSDVTLRLIPVIRETVFKLVQLRAAKNNVRPPHWMKPRGTQGEGDAVQQQGAGAAVLPPTPLYNLAILEDMVLLLHHRLMVKALGSSTVLRQTVLLLKVWLTQRGMRFSIDGFDGHHAGLLVAYLLQTKRIAGAGHTSAINVFQTVLTFIAEGNLSKHVLDFTRPDVRESKSRRDGSCCSYLESSLDTVMQLSSLIADDMWDSLCPVTLNHPIPSSDGSFNCFWRVSGSAVDLLEREARRGLKELQSHTDTSCYDNLFMRKMGFFGCHDSFVHIPFDGKCLPFLKDSSLEVVDKDVEACPPLQAVREASIEQRTAFSTILAHCLPQQHLSARCVQLATSALGDRVQVIHSLVQWVNRPADGPTSSDSSSPSSTPIVTSSDPTSAHFPMWAIDRSADRSFDFVVSLGILLNNDKQERRVDKGPTTADGSLLTDLAADPHAVSGDNPTIAQNFDELKRFRDFWGPKVELRRFKDGSIVEAVVWDQPVTATAAAVRGDESARGVPSVVEQVVRYAFGRHLTAVCGLGGEAIRPICTQLDRFLQEVSPLSSDRTTRRAVEALDSLRGILTSKVKELPLAIESVSCVSPALRYTSVHSVPPHPIVLSDMGSSVNAGSNKKSAASSKSMREMLKKHAGTSMSLLCPPLKVLVQLESTGKWPTNDLQAVIALKVALLLRLRQELSKQFQIVSVIHADSLDVCFEGFIFRLSLVASDEVESAAVRSLSDLAGDSALRSMAVARSLKTPPLHHSSVRSLKSEHPCYSGTVRLFTVWASKHCFTGHLCTELIELIVAHEFLHPSSCTPPGSILTGFYRSLLRVAEHDWESEPLVVDLSGEISTSPSVMLDIITNFRASRSHGKERSSDGPQVDCSNPAWNASFLDAMNVPMYVVSSADKPHKYWPSLAARSPEKMVLTMIAKSARSSAMRLMQWIKQPQHDDTSTDELLAIMSRRDAVMSRSDVVLRFHKSLFCRDPARAPPFARLNVYANTPVSEAGLHSLTVIESECICCPVQEEVVGRLRSVFHRDALFFWDGTTGDELGVLWRPAVKAASSFAILSSRNRVVPPGSDAITAMNRDELLLQLIDLARGLLSVHRIDDLLS